MAILGLALKNFMQIDGLQWAGAFAFNAFLSMFPLMILLVIPAAEKCMDLIEAGIIDLTKVTRTALQNAALLGASA